MGIPVETITFFKELFASVVRLKMSDDLIINLIWGVVEHEQKFEDDPYSLSLEEIKVLNDIEQDRTR